MRIVFVASNFSYSWATETHLAHDLELLGHEVHKLHERTTLEAIERTASDADAVFYMKAQGLPPEAIGLWNRLGKRGVRTASYHLDLYYGLARQFEIGTDPMWRTEYVFTADGDPAFQQYCDELGINHRWMPAAIVSDEIGRGRYRADYAYPLVFVGKIAGYHPEWPWREQMVRALTNTYRDEFKVWTHADNMWDWASNDLYASSKVVVGDSLALPGHRNYWSNRYYETIGRGGFLVAPYVPGLYQHVTVDHMSWYEPGNVESLIEMVDLGLKLTREERAQIVGDGMAHVAAHHTYRHRALAMLEQMGLT